MDAEKIEKIKKLIKDTIGPEGTYVLMLSKAYPANPTDAQIWSEGPATHARGLVEVGREFIIQRTVVKSLITSPADSKK